MMRRLFLIALIFALAPASGLPATKESDAAALGRVPNELPYSYGRFARYLLGSIPELDRRPAHFMIAFDRTDSIWGKLSQYNVLPTVWRRDLLGMLLQRFMVEGRSPDEGDRISILAYGRNRTERILWDRPYRRRDICELTEMFPRPYSNTRPSEQGSDHEKFWNDARSLVKEIEGEENVVLILLVDGIQEGRNASGPKDAPVPWTYRAELQPGSTRIFEVYLYWNEFPDETVFLRYDEANRRLVEDDRVERVARQLSSEGPTRDQGTRTRPPIAWQNLITARQRAAAMWLIAGLAAVILAWLALMDWLRANYKVRVGGLDKIAWVFPSRRPRRIPMPNPQAPAENLGTFEITGAGLLGLHQARLRPDARYILTDKKSGLSTSRSAAATGRPGGKRLLASLPLVSGRRTPAQNVIGFRPADDVEPGYNSDADSGDESPSADPRFGEIVIPVLRRGGLGISLYGFRRRRRATRNKGRA